MVSVYVDSLSGRSRLADIVTQNFISASTDWQQDAKASELCISLERLIDIFQEKSYEVKLLIGLEFLNHLKATTTCLKEQTSISNFKLLIIRRLL